MRKRVIVDMVLNLISAAIPIFVLQLMILPLLASRMGGDEYGLFITILAMLNMIPSTFGNVLNNVRLLYEEKYRENYLEGDFSVIFLIYEVISAVLVLGGSIYYYQKIVFTDMLLIMIISALWAAREYYIVAFRLAINYKAILMNNVFLCTGYIIGYMLYLLCEKWQVIYIAGYSLNLLYIFRKSVLWKENIRATRFFWQTFFKSVILVIATLLPRLITYADKLIIYPLLGGTVVSVYYAATVFGKIISMVVSPVAGVILTYLSKVKKKNDDMFKGILLVGAIICVCGYLLIIMLSRPVLTLLYPQFVNEAMKYISITSATAVISAYISLINPFLMRFFDMSWQIIINILTIIVYISSTLVLINSQKLYGFCWGGLLSNIFKVLISLLIYWKSKESSLGRNMI